jgi:lipopolysaccharide/colanic/teichoic acid biosynthesis glycosyltransferase
VTETRQIHEQVIDLRDTAIIDAINISEDVVRDVIVIDKLLPTVRDNHPALLEQARRVRVIATSERATTGNGESPFDSPLPTVQRAAKRVLDCVLAAAIALATLPVLAAAAVAIKATSKGPVLFAQARCGRNGERFTLYKLRTMTIDNDDSEHRAYVASLIRGNAETHDGTFKLTHDPRVTRVGRILRKYSIDELPQLWNVLTGDMSIVGPRPSLPHEVLQYDETAWQRLRVKPGLTGLWQVSGRCDIAFEQMVQLDIAYWNNWSLLRDLAIIVKTPAVVLGARGAA